jgi:hypothetical protein
LEVTADKQEINFVFVSSFEGLDMIVDGVKLAMTAAFNSDFHRSKVSSVRSRKYLTSRSVGNAMSYQME